MAGLSRWWPWRRSPAPTAPPTGSPTAAAWRSLAPVQRTVGDLAQTAGFDEFTASLTTAQRPGLVAAPETLATADVASLPVLGADAVPAAPAAPTAVPAPRTWRPALALPQRMSAAPPNVQRSVDPAPDASRSAAELEIPATGSAPELPSAPELFEAPALLQAPAPDDVRDVAVVPEPELGSHREARCGTSRPR
ncbi:hypothetical protein E4P42_12320 [Mycobacterium sp. PS03-16]|uniref:hypothetical protein n=1 Tax=Mycobacterium sp. PS03-16 TaxID=2559611 RepID=UPI00107305A0|nr:hypothetical protein [Mycobacterium sp. PS03-16]TFV58157.1 hypothetical protein E4P42_12320 [Mycobacterium sp. PS03-16]